MRILLQISLCLVFILNFFIPIMIGALLLNRTKEQKKDAIRISSFWLVNIIVILLMHFGVRGYLNCLYTIRMLWGLNWQYSEISDLTNMLSFTIIFSCILMIVLQKNNKKKKSVLLLLVSLGIILSIGGYSIEESTKNRLVINEVASNNETNYLPTNESYCDFVELYNAGKLIYKVDDLFLSDDSSNLQKIQLAECSLLPGDFLLVGLDKNNNTHCIWRDGEVVWSSPNKENNTLKNESFVISSQGEKIFLTDIDGKIIDQIYSELQEIDVSYARIEDGSMQWEMSTYTPGISNNEGFSGEKIQAPIFSHKSGFYKEPFELELSTDVLGEIYYTLDGSDPCKNGEKYIAPIYVYDKSQEKNVWNSVQNVVLDWKEKVIDETPVDKAFIIKAVTKSEDGEAISETVCATYFVNKNRYKEENVISIIAEPEDMFGDDGIFVTGREYDEWYEGNYEVDAPTVNWEYRGRTSEIEADIETFSDKFSIKDTVGIRVQGASARFFAKKRMAIFARKEYGGSKWFDGEIFGRKKVHSLLLREGLANAMIPYMVEDRNVVGQKSEPVVVFLNGEFWYEMYLQERVSNSYFESKYELQEDSVSVVRNGNSREGNAPREYVEIYDFIDEYDLSDVNNYEKFKTLVDIDSYIDMSCINLYLANMDWAEWKNYMVFRAEQQSNSVYGDGRWHWVLYDLDAVEWDAETSVEGVEQKELINPFTMHGKNTSNTIYTDTKMYRALSKNAEFRKQMVMTFMDLINHNFSVEYVESILSEWGLNITWNDSFFIKRPEPMIKFIKEEFNLSENCETIELGINDSVAGQIKLNSIYPDLERGSWSGKYFQDYPVELTAIAKKGYRFVKWTGDINSNEISIEFPIENGGTKVVAIFEKE